MYINVIKKKYRLLKYPKVMYHFFCITMLKISASKLFNRNIFLEKAKRKGKAVGRSFISNEKFNNTIKEKIISKQPFFSCRYGNSELTACFYALMREWRILDYISDNLLKIAKSGPGVFPENEETYMYFASEYKKALKHADLNAYWGSTIMEEYLIDSFMKKDLVQYAMRALEPFQYEEPWTMALAGKKVLIVHPFSELIESQYNKKNEIFPNKEILPDFQLITVKAVQSSGETIPTEYKNWHEALDYVYNECMNKDFDIALLACGSYAVPLGARLKELGKQVMVLGGMMQLMFGIKGARWEQSRPDIVAMYNDAWIRAGKEYRTKDADKMVDGPAYW